MKSEITATLAKTITAAFGEALNDVIDKIGEMLESKISENETDEQQVQQTKLTLAPKVLITYVKPGNFGIEVRIPAKKIEIVTGEAEAEFSCNENGEMQENPQQELPGLNGGQNPGSESAPEGELDNE